MVNYLGKRTRVEFNGHDVSHITGVSIGGLNKIFDTFQTVKDPYDHDIEITEEASGSFDIVADIKPTKGGSQKFREMMQMVNGYVDLADGDGTALANLDNDDSIIFSDEDWTDLDTQGSYTGSRFLTHFKRISTADSQIAFDDDNDTIWIRFKALGENIDSLGLSFTSNGGSGGNAATMKVDVYDELSFGNISMGETAALASGGSTTTLEDSGILDYADNTFIGATIKFLSGSNAGLTRRITDSATSNDSVTFATVPTAVASGDKYMIYGVPSSTATGSFTEASFTIPQGNFDGVNKWRLLSSSDLGATWTSGDDLTIGKHYWLRVYRVSTTGNEPRIRVTTSADEISSGEFHVRTASTDPYTDTTVTATPEYEAVHYIKFKTTEGLNVVVYDYIDQAETGGLKYTFNKVKLESVSPSFANRQATRATVSWTCNDWAFDEI